MPNYNDIFFQGVPKKNANKSRFNLSHEWKHDFTLGKYIPCLMLPTMPGDEFEIESEFYMKFDPLYFPAIQRFNMECDYFYTPNRIMWQKTTGTLAEPNGWIDFIMSQSEDQHPTVDAVMTHFTTGASNNSALGYMGIPYLISGEGRSTTITGLNAFPLAALLHIRDEYYRIPQLEGEVRFNLKDGDNTLEMQQAWAAIETGSTADRYEVFNSRWQKDYLTSCLPEPQIGTDTVQIPMMANIDYTSENDQITIDPSKLPGVWRKLADGTYAAPAAPLEIDATIEGQTIADGVPVGLDIQQNAADVLELGLAIKLQRYRERIMKIGAKYKDWVLGLFGNDPQPGDIQVPVMFGNYRGVVQISEVLTKTNTTVGESDFMTGDYTGNASLYENQSRKLKYYCAEHGIITAILNITPNTGYGQGINRYWRYSLPTDYPLDMFSTIGDQEVLKEEVLYNNVTAEAAKNLQTFGYIPRFSEAKYMNNIYGTNLPFNAGLSVHGGRWWDPSTTTGSNYDERIEISQRFVSAAPDHQEGTRVANIFRALTFPNGAASQNPIYGYIMHKIFVNRNLPTYSTPSIE